MPIQKIEPDIIPAREGKVYPYLWIDALFIDGRGHTDNVGGYIQLAGFAQEDGPREFSGKTSVFRFKDLFRLAGQEPLVAQMIGLTYMIAARLEQRIKENETLKAELVISQNLYDALVNEYNILKASENNIVNEINEIQLRLTNTNENPDSPEYLQEVLSQEEIDALRGRAAVLEVQLAAVHDNLSNKKTEVDAAFVILNDKKTYLAERLNV